MNIFVRKYFFLHLSINADIHNGNTQKQHNDEMDFYTPPVFISLLCGRAKKDVGSFRFGALACHKG